MKLDKISDTWDYWPYMLKMALENKQKEENINSINLSWKGVIYLLTATIEWNTVYLLFF